MSPPKPDAATATNVKLLARFFSGKKIFTLPWLGKTVCAGRGVGNIRR